MHTAAHRIRSVHKRTHTIYNFAELNEADYIASFYTQLRFWLRHEHVQTEPTRYQ